MHSAKPDAKKRGPKAKNTRPKDMLKPNPPQLDGSGEASSEGRSRDIPCRWDSPSRPNRPVGQPHKCRCPNDRDSHGIPSRCVHGSRR